MIGGDIITAVDQNPVGAVQELADQIQNHKPGDEVTLTIIRDGRSMDVSVTLEQNPG